MRQQKGGLLMQDYWSYIGIVLLMLCSAFFSSSEIAYASANKLRLKRAKEAGGVKGKWAYFISENHGKALCTILIGNNLVNIAASSVATVIATSLAGSAGVAYATGIMTVLLLIFGEIVPKQLAKQHADSYVVAMAPVLRFLMIITSPIVTVFMRFIVFVSKLWGGVAQKTPMTDDELATVIETVEEEGVIDQERRDLLQSAINFNAIKAEGVITYRKDILAIDINDSAEEIIKTALDSPYSHIPIYDGSIDNIIGVLSLNRLLKSLSKEKTPDIRQLITEVSFVHKSKKLPVVLDVMRRKKIHIVVVTDDYGGTLGILTMEDILEQLVGEIWDETDKIRNEFTEVSENTYEVDGNVSIRDFLDYFHIRDDKLAEQFVTLAGWSIERLDGFPKQNDSFKYKNLTVTVAETDELRVTKLCVMVN
jgi:CBS domain containing-hemolysin-like protein